MSVLARPNAERGRECGVEGRGGVRRAGVDGVMYRGIYDEGITGVGFLFRLP